MSAKSTSAVVRTACLASIICLPAACGGGAGEQPPGCDAPCGPAGGAPGNVPPPNRPPTIATPPEDQQAIFGRAFDFDAGRDGRAFADPDADPLVYRVNFQEPARGLAAQGARITGTPSGVGEVIATISAEDGRGGTASHTFKIHIRAPELGKPQLPGVPFIYADAELDLPAHIRALSSGDQAADNTPPDNPVTNAGAALGRVLFYDRRLSVTDTVGCASCHQQSRGFADRQSSSVGFQGGHTRRNAMALTNARYYKRGHFLWDERAATLEEQVLLPIENTIEMGFDLTQLEAKLAAVDFYPPLFEAAFGSPDVTRDRIARALAQFVRSLISYRSKYDTAFVDGVPDFKKVFTPQELLGAQLFGIVVDPTQLQLIASARCILCHTTDAQIGVEPQNNGLDFVAVDVGAGNGRFKTPSLRNIAVSGPYMHDGRHGVLRTVIEHYNSLVRASAEVDEQLLASAPGEPRVARRLNLTEEQKQALVAFLNTLTDVPMLTDPKFSDPFPTL